MVDVGLFLSYILVGVCALAAVGMPLIKTFGDPQSFRKIGIGVGALVVVFVISLIIADNTVYEKASAGTSRMVGAGLIAMYFLTFFAVIGIVYTEVSKMIK